jgi:hypothetical protein
VLVVGSAARGGEVPHFFPACFHAQRHSRPPARPPRNAAPGKVFDLTWGTTQRFERLTISTNTCRGSFRVSTLEVNLSRPRAIPTKRNWEPACILSGLETARQMLIKAQTKWRATGRSKDDFGQRFSWDAPCIYDVAPSASPPPLLCHSESGESPVRNLLHSLYSPTPAPKVPARPLQPDATAARPRPS